MPNLFQEDQQTTRQQKGPSDAREAHHQQQPANVLGHALLNEGDKSSTCVAAETCNTQHESHRRGSSVGHGQLCWAGLDPVDLPSQNLAQNRQYRDTVTCLPAHNELVKVVKVQ